MIAVECKIEIVYCIEAAISAENVAIVWL